MKGATASQLRPARRSGRSWLLRAGLVLALAGMVQVGGAGPASAHAVGGGPTASNYRTSVRGIEPAIPGVSVRVVDGGNQLELTNRGSQEVTLLGYENEPYLRVGPSGVFENEHSPSTFSNRSTTAPKQIPAEFSADAQPDWRRVSSQPVAVFHDHRAHWSGAEPDVPALARSQLPSGLDPMLTRAAISATLGLGAGMLLAALLGRQLGTGRLAPAGATAAAKRPRGSSAGGSKKRSRKSGGR